MNAEQLETLLWEDEGLKLDFKRDQYPFYSACNDAKSEILKDILAFANSWGRSDAYILVGVEEIKGGKSLVRGVQHHLDDNDLQQFVNGKTQQPVDFSYRAFAIDGRQIGVIHIPSQERPLYLKRDFGRLRAEKVYIRRGSSTAEATPEEVAAMGRSVATEMDVPQLEIAFSDPSSHELLGQSVRATAVELAVPGNDEIPDYYGADNSLVVSNRDYYRELARYESVSSRMIELKLSVLNQGATTALDVGLEGVLSGEGVSVFKASILPIRPRAMKDRYHFGLLNSAPDVLPDFEAASEGDRWRIDASFGKCQPKRQSYTHTRLFLYSPAPTEVALVGRLFADNLPDPVEFGLEMSVEIEQRTLLLDELCESEVE